MLSCKYSNLTDAMRAAQTNNSLKEYFEKDIKGFLKETLEMEIPDFIHLKGLVETSDSAWLIIPPKPDNWPNIFQIILNRNLKPNELQTVQARFEAVSAAIDNGDLSANEVFRAILQSLVIAKAWADTSFLQNLLSSPEEIINKIIEVNQFPFKFNFKVLEETADRRYMVLPSKSQSLKWQIAATNAWAYSLAQHGIELPFVGALLGICTNSTRAAYANNNFENIAELLGTQIKFYKGD